LNFIEAVECRLVLINRQALFKGFAMQQSLMQQGFDLLIYGMGTVFVFLTVLVFVTMGMSAVMRRFFPDPVDTTVITESVPVASVSPSVLVAIKAAIEQHRNKRR
jgi:oxaloacetate decarboxylase gamma subunit